MVNVDAAGPSIAVVGSINMDLVVRVERLPDPGETVTGGDLARFHGGKGANQAVAAARLGRAVALVGCVGDDEAGRELVDALRVDGVDVSNVRSLAGAPSGTALIAVAEHGENLIVVSPGANARVGVDLVEAARPVLEAAAVTLVQLEIPMEAVAATVRAAGGTTVLNPAPARDVPEEVLEQVDVLVPNRVELGRIARMAAPDTPQEAVAAVRRLRGVAGMVVVTLGAQGALVGSGNDWDVVPAPRVDPVDTTAAGDAFCGGLADALALGRSLDEAVRWATRVAAVTVTRQGAQESLPRRAEVEAAP
jgi:ribokinase